MSRINFGYLLGRGFDHFGKDKDSLDRDINRLRTQALADFKANIGIYQPSLAYTAQALKISLDGEYNDLEKDLLNVIEQQGLPKFVALPSSRFDVPFVDHILAKRFPDTKTLTTSDAYELIKGIYRERKARVSLLTSYLEKER